MKSSSIVLSFLFAGSLVYADMVKTLETISVESSTIDDKFMDKKNEVSSVANVSSEKVDESHIENIQQILQQIPGITSEIKSGDSLKIHIRGVENQMYMGEKPGVAVVIDGVPVFERTGAVNIDLDNIESIKVIKGGASYLFGDDALSGAVIITTKRGAHYSNNFASVEAGSFGYQKLLARTGYANENMSFHLQGSERKADGYWEDSNYSAKYFNGKFQYYIDDSSDITFGTEYSKRKKDSHGTVGGISEAYANPTSAFTGDMQSRDYTRMYDVDLLKLFTTYSKDFANNSNLLLSAYMYTDDTYYWSAPQTRNAAGALGTYTDNDYLTDNFYEQTQTGVKSEYRSSFESFATLLGIDVRDNEYKNRTVNRVSYKTSAFSSLNVAGDEKSKDVTDENVYAVYGEYKQQLTEKLSSTFNVRYDTITMDYTNLLDNTQLDKEFNVYSYRAGLNYDLTDTHSLFTNYSTGFRAPTISQLFAGDVSAWGSTQNNENLKEEKSHNYEIGTRGYLNTLFYEVSLFRLDRKDFIMKSSGNYGATATNEIWDNIGGARHQGLEMALSDKLTQKLKYNLAYTYLDATYTNYENFGIHFDANHNGRVDAGEVTSYNVTGNTIPRTPKHAVNLVLDYEVIPKLNFISEINNKSSYYADDLNTIKIDNTTTLNLLSTYKTKVNSYDLTFFARVDNVFDEFYFNTARASSDRNGDLVFNAEDLSLTVNQGRTFTTGLALKF